MIQKRFFLLKGIQAHIKARQVSFSSGPFSWEDSALVERRRLWTEAATARASGQRGRSSHASCRVNPLESRRRSHGAVPSRLLLLLHGQHGILLRLRLHLLGNRPPPPPPPPSEQPPQGGHVLVRPEGAQGPEVPPQAPPPRAGAAAVRVGRRQLQVIWSASSLSGCLNLGLG